MGFGPLKPSQQWSSLIWVDQRLLNDGALSRADPSWAVTKNHWKLCPYPTYTQCLKLLITSFIKKRNAPVGMEKLSERTYLRAWGQQTVAPRPNPACCLFLCVLWAKSGFHICNRLKFFKKKRNVFFDKWKLYEIHGSVPHEYWFIGTQLFRFAQMSSMSTFSWQWQGKVVVTEVQALQSLKYSLSSP